MLLETLESRQLYSASVSAEGVLTITGTEGNDVISVSKKDGVITVKQNGQRETFESSTVKQIVADLGAGNDVFAAHGSIRHRMIVDGGAGDDNIRGGYGNDRLIGGSGDDSLNASYGSDTLIGGAGSDRIDASIHAWAPHNGFSFAIYHFHDPDADVIETDGDKSRDRIVCSENDTVRKDGFDRVTRVPKPIMLDAIK